MWKANDRVALPGRNGSGMGNGLVSGRCKRLCLRSRRSLQTQEGGSHDRHAQAAHHSERGEPGPGSLANRTIVKLLKVRMTTPPVAIRVSLGGPLHSGAGGACA